jgi:hypothetical protein
MLQVLLLNVAESHVEPKHQGPMFRHVMLSVVEGRTTRDVGCCKHSFSILQMLSFDVADM